MCSLLRTILHHADPLAALLQEYLKLLCSQIEPRGGVIPKIEDRFEPLAAIYPQEALASFQTALSGTDFSLQTVVGRLAAEGKVRVVPVTSQERNLFLNLNELSDLTAL